jgi:ankyrin repeat protein
MRLLYQENAEVDGRDRTGRTALCIAASNGQHLAVEELLKAGPSIKLINIWGKTSLS